MSLFSLRTNLSALGTSRNFTAHYVSLADSVRRLSTGLRVERAADDAAGLAIRELMRADVASLHQGARNVDDAISLIQTADGALSIIDEKLIRMKELAEQAATGTYDSTQRLMIDSEFQQMASEIERIARATDFNGIHLLDGSLSGPHDGSQMEATGALKIHFGTGNDSAEDYYYIQIGDATLAGLGLMDTVEDTDLEQDAGETTTGNAVAPGTWEGTLADSGMEIPPLNDRESSVVQNVRQTDALSNMQDILPQQGVWYNPKTPPTLPIGLFQGNEESFTFRIPAGSKNVVINIYGCAAAPGTPALGDQDIQLFTTSGVHLVGTPYPSDAVFDFTFANSIYYVGFERRYFPFKEADYDGHLLNTGPAFYDPTGNTLQYMSYNGMTIGYSGDPDRYETGWAFNDGRLEAYADYEVLVIDEVTEDLIFWMPGMAAGQVKAYWNLPDAPKVPPVTPPDVPPDDAVTEPEASGLMSIKTQELAQKGIVRLDAAIVRKDQIRSHLGAVQNRLENTVTNLNIQAENLQAAESRISDADIATEMANFVRNQVMTQTATAMLSQANTFPHMLLQLIGGRRQGAFLRSMKRTPFSASAALSPPSNIRGNPVATTPRHSVTEKEKSYIRCASDGVAAPRILLQRPGHDCLHQDQSSCALDKPSSYGALRKTF